VTIVPSRFSMKKQPATRRAVLRCRGSIINRWVRPGARAGRSVDDGYEAI